jgi:hypothetical protein
LSATCAVANSVAYAHAVEAVLGLTPTPEMRRARTLLLDGAGMAERDQAGGSVIGLEEVLTRSNLRAGDARKGDRS